MIAVSMKIYVKMYIVTLRCTLTIISCVMLIEELRVKVL